MGRVQGLKFERYISDPAPGNLGDEHFEKTRVFWASSSVTKGSFFHAPFHSRYFTRALYYPVSLPTGRVPR